MKTINSKIALSLILSASSAFAMYDAYPECEPTTTTVTVTVEVTPDFCSGVEPTLNPPTSTPCDTETFVPPLETTSTPCDTETFVPPLEPTSTPCDTETFSPTLEPTTTPCETVDPSLTPTSTPEYGYGYGEPDEETLPVAEEATTEIDPNIANESHLMTSFSAIVMGSLLMLL